MRELFELPSGACTALCVFSPQQAYVALQMERSPRGPCGESNIAQIWHTHNAGLNWSLLNWRRSWLSQVRYPGFPNWPPESILQLQATQQGLVIRHRDEHVLFEPGGESLWESRYAQHRWHIHRLYKIDYDGPSQPIPEIQQLDLPQLLQGMQPPPNAWLGQINP